MGEFEELICLTLRRKKNKRKGVPPKKIAEQGTQQQLNNKIWFQIYLFLNNKIITLFLHGVVGAILNETSRRVYL